MASPNPMGIAECQSTVREVLRDLRRGKGIPVCKLSNGLNSKSDGNHVVYRRASYLPSCPNGTHDGLHNILYHQGKRPDYPTPEQLAGGVSVTFGTAPLSRDELVQTSRVCVGGQNYGQYIQRPRWSRNDDSVGIQTHRWYEKIVWMQPDGASYEFDVIIDGKHHSRHRF